MARSVEEDYSDMPGQDSFLDVLTNMVGIIILLVVVTGLRTSQAVMASAKKQLPATAEESKLKKELVAAQNAVIAAKRKTESLIQQVANVHGEAAFRQQERDYLTSYVAAFEQELKDRRAELSAGQQQDFDLRRKLVESQTALEELSREKIGLLAQPTEVAAIQNQPTPLAHRSAGKVVQLHLAAGHLAIIPEEFADEAIADIKENIWRLKDQPSFVKSIGPIGGFRLRYRVALVPLNGDSPGESRYSGAPYALPSMMQARLIWYEFIPETTPLGESVSQALEANSDFRNYLREHPPDTTPVAIVVYPDSIRELHELKDSLHSLGYAVAETPLPPGRPLRCSIYAGRSGEDFFQ